MRGVLLACASACTFGVAAADDHAPELASSALRFDTALTVAPALGSGMDTHDLGHGIAAGVGYGHRIVWGARATYLHLEDDEEVALLATATVEQPFKRATFGLRFGLGGTLVQRDRDEMMPGLSKIVQTTTLEGVIALRLSGAWALTVSAGPSAKLLSGSVHGAWSGSLGVAWQR